MKGSVKFGHSLPRRLLSLNGFALAMRLPTPALPIVVCAVSAVAPSGWGWSSPAFRTKLFSVSKVEKLVWQQICSLLFGKARCGSSTLPEPGYDSLKIKISHLGSPLHLPVENYVLLPLVIIA